MGHPALVLLLAWLAVAAFDRLRPGTASMGRHVWLAASVVSIGTYCAIVAWYTFEIAYFDAAEPTITAVASVFAAGKPLYPNLDAPERYAHIYGPSLFIVHAAALRIAGPTILASKAVGALAAGASLIIAYRVFRDRAGARSAVPATALCALVYMHFSNVTFWTRPDPLLILCVVTGLAAAHVRQATGSSIVLGVAIGAAVNLKVTGPLYLLPILPIAIATNGMRVLIGTAIVALAVAAAPFLLPAVSLGNYWDYIELSARNGLRPARIQDNVEWGIFLCAPLAGVLWSTRLKQEPTRSAWTMCSALAVCIGLIAVAASKPGGGPFHLLPFVPILAYSTLSAPKSAWDRPGMRALAVGFGIAALLLAVPKQRVFLQTVAGRDLETAVSDLTRFADANPSRRIAVGYAGTSHLSHARPAIVFRSGDYLIDAPAVQEHRLSGLPVPPSTLQALNDCRIELWLVPRNGGPFVVPSAYAPQGPREVFPEEFLDVFRKRHFHAGSTEYFDIWECRPASDLQGIS